MFAQEFQARVLPFDAEAADIYADLRILRARSSRPLGAEDGMIAAIAKAQGAAVVTRDTGGFDGCGVTLVDP